jgi:hypothetical protein
MWLTILELCLISVAYGKIAPRSLDARTIDCGTFSTGPAAATAYCSQCASALSRDASLRLTSGSDLGIPVRSTTRTLITATLTRSTSVPSYLTVTRTMTPSTVIVVRPSTTTVAVTTYRTATFALSCLRSQLGSPCWQRRLRTPRHLVSCSICCIADVANVFRSVLVQIDIQPSYVVVDVPSTRCSGPAICEIC